MTDKEATDEINTLVLTAWDAGALAAIENDTLGTLEWQGRTSEEKPDGFWARVTQQIVSQAQRSLADENTFGANQKRYETHGVVTVQVFGPSRSKNAFRKGDALASLLRDAFRTAGQTGNVWYSNARKRYLTMDGAELRWNVVAEFSYDTIV